MTSCRHCSRGWSQGGPGDILWLHQNLITFDKVSSVKGQRERETSEWQMVSATCYRLAPLPIPHLSVPSGCSACCRGKEPEMGVSQPDAQLLWQKRLGNQGSFPFLSCQGIYFIYSTVIPRMPSDLARHPGEKGLRFWRYPAITAVLSHRRFSMQPRRDTKPNQVINLEG